MYLCIYFWGVNLQWCGKPPVFFFGGGGSAAPVSTGQASGLLGPKLALNLKADRRAMAGGIGRGEGEGGVGGGASVGWAGLRGVGGGEEAGRWGSGSGLGVLVGHPQKGETGRGCGVSISIQVLRL